MKIYSAQHRAIVEAPIMEEPKTKKYGLEYLHDRDDYEEWLTTHIPVLPEHQALFKDGQEVKEDIDYYILKEGIDYEVDYPPTGRELTQYPKQVAIPIKQQDILPHFPRQSESFGSYGKRMIEPTPSSEEDKEPLPQQEVKNLPTKIYLQIGDDHWDDKKVDFKDLHEVSWCEDKINSNDIPYVLESQLSEALATIKSQEAEIADLRKQLK